MQKLVALPDVYLSGQSLQAMTINHQGICLLTVDYWMIISKQMNDPDRIIRSGHACGLIFALAL
jgi:hypothetical protein